MLFKNINKVQITIFYIHTAILYINTRECRFVVAVLVLISYTNKLLIHKNKI